MKRFHIPLLQFAVLAVALSSCSKSSVNPTQDGNWIYVGDFGGNSRTEAVSFVIGNLAYVGTGIDNNNTRYSDLWSFDPSGTTWYQVATAPAGFVPRSSAVAFALSGEGYVGTGYDGYNYYSDFWQYDPGSNSWKQIAPLSGPNGPQPRLNAVAFGLDKFGFGYVGTGNNSLTQLNDFWKYDPSVNQWNQIATYPGYKREQAVAFTYNDKGYLVTGLGTGGAPVNDFLVLDPSKPDTSQWSSLRHITNYSPDSYDDGYTSIVRYNSVGFVMLNTISDGGGDRAYISTGAVGGSITWAYNFATDLWNQKTSYERASRQGAVGFAVQNRGFVGLGSPGGVTTGSASSTFANMDEWKPDQPYNQQD